MPVSVVVGGQFGSEGKGKVAHYFAKELNAEAVIRVGGPNSGHTVINEFGQAMVFKCLPTAAILDKVTSVLTSGNYINLSILQKEIELSKIHKDRLIIDPMAMMISSEDLEQEAGGTLMNDIASTGSGTGAALMRRIKRTKSVRFAKDEEQLKDYIKSTQSYLRNLLDEDKRVIIEGTQGFGLSLLHSDLYPYATCRDTTAAAFVSEAGLSPLDVDDIILVIRAFPIRVGGNSGPLPNETTWEEVTKESGSTNSLIEYTSVTRKVRRVAHFDPEIVKKAIEYNNPTKVVLNHVDYVDNSVSAYSSKKNYLFTKSIEESINRQIDYLGYNPKTVLSRFEIEKLNNLIA